MQNGKHKHNCHICGEDFECAAITHCSIEDKYAVCYKQECINEFENPTQRENYE